VDGAGAGDCVAERGDQGELAGLGGVDRDRAGAVEDFRAAALPMVEQGGGVEDAVLRLAQEADMATRLSTTGAGGEGSAGSKLWSVRRIGFE
jgi:hypothetical protein